MDEDSAPQAPSENEAADLRTAQANKLFQTGVMLLYGKRKSVDRAIKCIQRAITFNDSDYKYWQILGESYYQRGSLNPAINCFIKSLNLAELDRAKIGDNDQQRIQADCTYSRLRMSDIRLSVGHFDEAASGYDDIIHQEPENVAALIGLSKTKLQLARNSFSTGQVKLGHSHCMEALKNSLRAIKLKPQLCLTWKLAADCCLIQFVHGQRGDFRTTIEERFPGTGDRESLTVDRITCLDLSEQFLCKAIEIEPFRESVCLWHNLGITLYFKSTLAQDTGERQILLKRSMKCLLKALKLDRSNSQVRNSTGVVAFNLNLLNSAQNFLIKSIQSNMSTSEVQFSNLGYIYLQKGESRLAGVAFNRSQAEEPLYSRAWLGNAMLNEQNNLDNLTQLRHCQRLENNYDSHLMFATKISSLPHSEEFDRDLLVALDSMSRIINYSDQSIEANTTLGLLYERCNFIAQARLCFEKVFQVTEDDTRATLNKLRLHLATKSCFSVENPTSLEDNAAFLKSVERVINRNNREHMLNYIYYLFNNGDFRNVNSKMTKLLEILPQNDVRGKIGAQILLGLAAKAEGCDYKSWLFKNIIDLENLVCIEASINLLCLMLLGAVTNDHELVMKISDDIGKHLLSYVSTRHQQLEVLLQSREGCWIRLALFCSIFCLEDRGKLIRPLVALFPTVEEFWMLLGLSLMFDQDKRTSAVFCIVKASLLGSVSADLVAICDILLAVLAGTQSPEARARYLSLALHKCPHYSLLWTSLRDSIGRQTNSAVLNRDNSKLLQLAISHAVIMIMAT